MMTMSSSLPKLEEAKDILVSIIRTASPTGAKRCGQVGRHGRMLFDRPLLRSGRKHTITFCRHPGYCHRPPFHHHSAFRRHPRHSHRHPPCGPGPPPSSGSCSVHTLYSSAVLDTTDRWETESRKCDRSVRSCQNDKIRRRGLSGDGK